MDELDKEIKITKDEVNPRYATVSVTTAGGEDEQKTYTGQTVVLLVLHPLDEAGEPKADGLQQYIVGHTSMGERAALASALRDMADKIMPDPISALLNAIIGGSAQSVADGTGEGPQ